MFSENSIEKAIKCGLCFWAVCVFFTALNPISIYIIVPLSFVYCLSRYNIFNKNRYFRLYMWLVVWVLLTSISGYYFDLSMRAIRTLILTTMLSYVCCCLSEKYQNYKTLYFVWVCFFIGIFLYIIKSGLLSIVITSHDTRLNDGELNANVVAYAMFYLTFALYMFGELMQKTRLYKMLFFISIPLSFIVALLTASRQVLIIQVPLIFLLISIRYTSILNHAKTLVIGLCLITTIGYQMSDKIVNVYQNSLLAQRAQKNLEKDSRSKLLKDAFKVGMEHPIVGVGPGNYVKFSYNKHFSHCTYTELFACSGVPALCFYLLMLGVFFAKQISYYIRTKDTLFLSFLTFGFFFVVDNFFYVFYYKLFLMPFFLIVGSHSDAYYRKIKSSASLLNKS